MQRVRKLVPLNSMPFGPCSPLKYYKTKWQKACCSKLSALCTKHIKMKKLTTLIAALIISCAAFAQGIEFEHGTFDEALAKAKAENKLVFMDCYTTWCGPCKYLAKEIFTQKEVGDYFNKNFVNVKMDMEKGEGIALNTKYGVKAYPTLLFIDGNGNVVQKLVGGMKAEELIAGGKTALDPSMRMSALKEKYDKGNRDYDFLMTYLDGLKRQHDKENMAVVAKQLINQKSIEDYMNKEMFYVISAAAYPYGSEEFNYLLKNKDKVKEMTEPYEFGGLYYSPIRGHLSAFVQECKSLDLLYAEVEKCNELFDMNQYGDIKEPLTYSWYIANNKLQKWYDEKIKAAEALKGEQQYIYNYHSICDEILRTPALAAEDKIVDDFLIKAVDFASDKETGIIMGNLMLAKLYLHKKEKEKALNAFNLFFAENGKAGGNNTHPSVSNLKASIEAL